MLWCRRSQQVQLKVFKWQVVWQSSAWGPSGMVGKRDWRSDAVEGQPLPLLVGIQSASWFFSALLKVRQLAWLWGWSCWAPRTLKPSRTWWAMRRRRSTRRSCVAWQSELPSWCTEEWRRPMRSSRVSVAIRWAQHFPGKQATRLSHPLSPLEFSSFLSFLGLGEILFS